MRPKKSSSILLSLCFLLLFSLLPFNMATSVQANEHEGETTFFEDVPKEHWAYNYIQTLYSNNIVNGYSETEFRPEMNIDRGQFVSILSRSLDLERTDHDSKPFTDLHGVLADEIVAAHEAGIVEGRRDGTFGQEESLNREQMAILLVRAYEYETGNDVDTEFPITYKDVRDINPTALPYVKAATALGFIQGTAGGHFFPQANTLRDQAAKVIYYFLEYDKEETFELSVLHTNDLHGRVNMYPQLITTVNEARETRPDALLLEAGDVFSGTLYFNEFRGQAALEFMNLMDYDAFVFGNHEFDLGDPIEGHPDLAKFIENANFPFLGANMDFSAHAEFDAFTGNKQGITYEAQGGMIYDGIVKEINGEEVGIFGINTEDTADISSPVNVTFSDFAEASAHMVEQFEEAGINKIIALTHLGFSSDPSVGNDLRLAAEVEGIDIIVGGHSHDALHDPVVITENEAGEDKDPTVIVQANEYGKYVGTLDVSFDSEGVLVDWEGELLDARKRDADPAAAELLKPYTQAIEKVQNEPAGFTLDEELPNPRSSDGGESVRGNETKLGNLIADGFLRAGKRANSDTLISFQNGGGIREALPAGDVTVGELIAVQPFGNRLTLLELTGAEIMEALELSVKDVPGENGGFLHISGMKFTFDSSLPAGERVQTVKVNKDGQYVDLDMDEMYVTAMNNFTATGGDGYGLFSDAYDEGRGTIVGDTDWQILRNHALQLVEEVGKVSPQIEGRILDVAGEDEGEKTLSLDIFHTNDIHGKINNFGKLSGFIDEKGAEADNYLYLDAGDIFSGNAVVDLQDGEPIVELLNEMGLTAMAIGNHEFDYGQEAFAAREEQANFDWLSANMEVVDTDIAIQQPEPYQIYEIDGVDVGVFSLTQNPPATRLSGIAGLEFHDYVETAEEYSYLQDETDILIALTHIGNSADKNLAENVDFFDVIIGGHSHSRVTEADIVNGTPVVQAGSDANFVGHFNLDFDGTDVTFNDYYLQDVRDLENVNQDVQDMVDAYNAEAEEILEKVVGITNTGLSRNARSSRDTSLGNFWTDSMLGSMDADIAITNNGGIRANIDPGDITAANIYTVEPFGNELSELEITGEHLREVVEYSYSDSYSNQNDLQTAGLTFTIYVDENDEYVDADLYVDGEPIDDNETYTLVTNNFMAEGGDGYDFTDAKVIQAAAGYVTSGMFQLIDELMESEGAVDYADGEGRIEIVVVDEDEDEGYGYYNGQSISDIRDTDFGTTQTLYGTVTAHFEEGGQTNMFVQDDTAAILVRGSGLGSEYKIGDKAKFTGEHNHFRDMNQLLVSNSEIVERNHGQITPKVVDSTFFDSDPDAHQAQLIEIKDVDVADNFGFNDYNATDSAGAFIVLGQAADVEENTEYDSITGVVNYHHFNNKLMPRNNDDLIEDASNVQPVRASHESGAIASGTEIILTSSTDGAEIYYTLNGDEPTTDDHLYDGPIAITEETTLKAVAVVDGSDPSDVREFNYTLLPEAGELEIYDIQGASHTSPYEGQVVRDVPGIVTHTENNGFYFQSLESDGDVNTSEGMYVYKRGHAASVGDDVLVEGKVVEYEESGFHDFSSSPNNDLRTTQIQASNLQVQSSGNDLPDVIVIGIDREIPETVLADPENYDINNPDDFDAENNALDFYESLEGMLVEIPGQVTITGPQKYDELTVISEEWDLDNRTDSGSVYLQENEQGGNYTELNTEVIFVNAPSGTIAKTGDYFEDSIVGVVGYNFSNFKIEPIGDGLPEMQDGGLERRDETTIDFEEDKLTVATYNVENFHPGANPERIDRLAESMANELNSPDILTLVEVMDNYGTTVGPNTDASESYQTLIDAIKEKSGVQYAYTEVAPIQGNDGGIPGGNIRNGHLYNVDRVELASDTVGPNNEGITINEDGSLSYGTGLIDPNNEAFNRSRKPLLSEFIFKGESVYVIGNHWNSKLGDEAPFGIVQPAKQGSREQRMKIATVIGDFLEELNEKTEGDANVVVLGDFNDYPWSPTVSALLETGNLYNSLFELDRSQQYTYSYNGSAQSLDSALVSEHLKSGMAIDAMAINSEFMWEHGRASDHDPLMVQLVIPNIDPDYEIVQGPELTFEDEELNSNSTIELVVGDDFDYPVVTATDSEGNELTVKRGGDEVDTETPATYTVVYTATDKEGRSSNLRLRVVVHPDLDMDNLTVAEAIAYNDGEGTVQGYIVGTMTGNFDGNFAATNLMLADDPDERDMNKILPVQLPNTSLRTEINLQDHPENLGKEVRVTGNLTAYFSRPGLRDTSAYEFVGNDDNGDNGDNGSTNDFLTNGGFESWTDGVLDGWDGSSNNIPASGVTQSEEAFEGDYSVNLIRDNTTHQRFSSESFELEEGVEYDISFMVKGNGEIRNAMFAEGFHSNNYSAYSAYTVVDSNDWKEVTWSYTAEGDVDNAQLIFSLRNTTEDHLFLDDVKITVNGN